MEPKGQHLPGRRPNKGCIMTKCKIQDFGASPSTRPHCKKSWVKPDTLLTQYSTYTILNKLTQDQRTAVTQCWFIYTLSLGHWIFSWLIFYPQYWVSLTHYCVGAIFTKCWVSFNPVFFRVQNISAFPASILTIQKCRSPSLEQGFN